MKKILYSSFIGIPSPDVGGPNKIIYSLMNTIDLSFYDVSFLSKNIFFKMRTDNFSNNKVMEVPFISKCSLFAFQKFALYRYLLNNTVYLLFQYFVAKRNFSRAIKSQRFDIIHSHDPRSMFLLKNISGIKILTIHSKGSLVKDVFNYVKEGFFSSYLIKLLEKIEREALQIADWVTFPSRAAKDLYLSELNLPDSDKYKIVYNGIEIGLEEQGALKSLSTSKYPFIKNIDSITILNVADHTEVKNIDLVLNVVRDLVHKYKQKVQFINIGGGPETVKLKNLVDKYEIVNEVNFLGYKPNSVVMDLMKRFDVFLILSERVVFDMVILEALVNRMLVIANDDGGNKEIIENGKNGFLVNPIDVDRISNLIIKHYEDNIIKDNSLISISKFSKTKMFKNYEVLYCAESKDSFERFVE